jgi:hypothetical protein
MGDGPITKRASIAVEIQRGGAALRGRYAYGSVGRAIELAGEVRPDGAWALTERNEGKVTGHFVLRPVEPATPDLFTTLTGTWTDAEGHGRPVNLRPGGPYGFSEDVPVGERRPVEPASHDEVVTFFVKLLSKEGKAVAKSVVDPAVHDAGHGWISWDTHSVPTRLGQGAVYRADANNDGSLDWIFVNTNDNRPRGENVGFYTEHGDTLADLEDDHKDFYDSLSTLVPDMDLPTWFPDGVDAPFVTKTPLGVTLNFGFTAGVDATGAIVREVDPWVACLHEHFETLWKGGKVRLLVHTRVVQTCQ